MRKQTALSFRLKIDYPYPAKLVQIPLGSTDDISLLISMVTFLEDKFDITHNNILSKEEAPKLQVLKANRKPNDVSKVQVKFFSKITELKLISFRK